DVSEVKRRSKIIFDLINEISYENNKKWIGWKGKVLFDEKSEDGIKGRNFAYKPIFVKEKVEIGQNHRVEIVDSTNHILIGKILS
ncbi:MAG: 2-methylthioadenine synthetase, partial [Nitrosopumilaceae archaeon]